MHLTIESLLSLILLVIVIAVPIPERNDGKKLDELYIIQKEHDLLKIWFSEEGLEENEMINDFMFVFSEKNGKIIINGVEFPIGKECTMGAISNKGIVFINGVKNIVSISVCK